jgi:hypothetical protein
MTTAIIRHKTSGEHFLATLDDSGDATGLSAPLAVDDVFGRDKDMSEITGEEWFENFGGADVEPLDEETSGGVHWTSHWIEVVHEI